MGTAPGVADTDGDQIPDFVEVRGFRYAGQDWYLDPTKPDTNGDGQLDSLECPPLIDGGTITEDVIRAQCDADGDGVPDLFQEDDDSDGVPDRVDLSPNDVLDRNGIAHDGTKLQANAAYSRAARLPPPGEEPSAGLSLVRGPASSSGDGRASDLRAECPGLAGRRRRRPDSARQRYYLRNHRQPGSPGSRATKQANSATCA